MYFKFTTLKQLKMKKGICLFIIIISWYSRVYTQNYPAISKEVLTDIAMSIPLPLELISLVKKLTVPFQANELPNLTSIYKVKNRTQQILKLGIFQTDLDYCYWNRASQSAKNFGLIMKDLADTLKLDKYGYPPTQLLINNLDKNNSSKIALSLHQSREHFVEQCVAQGFSETAILLISGAWFESLHLLLAIDEKYPSNALKVHIGEQKLVLDQILLLLSFYEENAETKAFINDLNQLQALFESVKIKYEYAPCKISYKSKGMMVEDKTLSKLVMSADTLQNIRQKVLNIRTKTID
jgi:hypothetical protein